MASATQHPSRLTIWLYRSLALGSTIAVATHTVPLMDEASTTHAIQLARSDEPFLAKAGMRRMAAAARKSAEKRERLKEHGALRALSDLAARGDEGLREDALHAVAVIGDGDHEAVVSERGLRDALGGQVCGDGCRAVWKVLGLENADFAQRRRMLEKLYTAG